MAPDCMRIKAVLEKEYDIPFTVVSHDDNGVPYFLISPVNSHQALFGIKVSFQNNVRLRMEFTPEKNAADFIHAMGSKSYDVKQQFINFALAMQENGAKLQIFVNGYTLSLNHPEDWPQLWTSFHAKITKLPIFEGDNRDYTTATCQWGSLMMGMILSLANIVPVDDEEPAGYVEGGSIRVLANRYERNLLNRKLCISSLGCTCKICGFNFESTYGKIGEGFIHVHHIVPVSMIGPGYIINPVKDLIPVCPNCHAMLHQKIPPYLPDVIKSFIYDESIDRVAEPPSEYKQK